MFSAAETDWSGNDNVWMGIDGCFACVTELLGRREGKMRWGVFSDQLKVVSNFSFQQLYHNI